MVTGGGRGIAREIALALAGQGADVCLLARSQDQIEAVAEELRGMGQHGLALACDVADYDADKFIVDDAAHHFGRLDILVNNAGGGKIINVGSGMGHSARAGNSAYNVSKADLWMLTRCLAMEVWQHGIEVNELVPGPVYTDLTKDVFEPPGGAPPPIAQSERVKPPEDRVPLAMFLATHPPGGPTGQSFSLARRPL